MSERIIPSLVRLVEGKGTSGRGGDEGGKYWHIYVEQTRAGYIYINLIDTPPLGKHASLEIHINKNKRGQGIGRVAYRLACQQSGYSTVYAEMRKSNIASRKAAEAAGFQKWEKENTNQLIMVWHEKNK